MRPSQEVFDGEGQKVTMAVPMREVPDEPLRNLMRAAQDGDADAYRALLTAITPRLRRLIRTRRAFLGPDDVEDLVQDVLLSVHRVRHTYDPARPFFPWLLAIVRNRLADAARRYARQKGHELAVDNLDVTFSTLASNTSDEGVADDDALARAIQQLPEAQRQAIELLKLREMSLKEAAASSGSSVSALKVATHRAMASLRRALGATREHDH
jgi:RNA polymerase sigma-70 factor (ECF subfamily)